MYRKLQATADVIINLPLLKKDGSQAVGLDLGTLFTKIISPTGAVVSGYTEATFTEPNGDGVYCAKFLSVAGTKAFTVADQPNPYTLTLDSSVTDVEPFSIDIWIVSNYIWELSTQSSVDVVQNELATMSISRRTVSDLPQQVFRPSVGDKYIKVDVLLYDGNGGQYDPPDNTNYNAIFDVGTVDGSGTILTSSIVSGGKGYVIGDSIYDAVVTSGTLGGSGASFTVSTVDGNGAILTYAMVSGGVAYNADNTLRSSSHMPKYDYDGLGFIASDEAGNAFTCYKNNTGTPLDVVSVCHHTNQANKPQHILRTSTGVYYYYIKIAHDVPLQTMHFKLAWFDLVGDTTTHHKELYQMTIADASVLDSIKGDTTQLLSDVAALPTESSIITSLMGKVIEGSITFQQMLTVFSSVLAGKSGGGGTSMLTFRDLADTKNRVTAVVDPNGDRVTITLDLS